MSADQNRALELDAAYRAFPTFETWASRSTVDTIRWERYNADVDTAAKSSPELLERAREIAKRAAALDTGAIEGLYEVDSGFTYTVAFEVGAWEVALSQKGEAARPLFEAQMRGYNRVLDLATGAQPLGEAAIRALHEVICSAQETYRVATAVGPQEQPLPKGIYKHLPNHVRTRRGADHAYAPVDMTGDEMARLLRELRSEAFLAAHPVVQAAYAHYCLVVIHPFADGNGRTARALASVYTYKAVSMPIVIFAEHKGAYLDALEEADAGDFQPFTDFILNRCLDTVSLVGESIRSAAAPDIEETSRTITKLYYTRGGYTHEQVDAAGIALLDFVGSKIEGAIAASGARKVHGNVFSKEGQLVDQSDISFGGPGDNLRHPLGRGGTIGGRYLAVSLHTASPIRASVETDLRVLVPQDANHDDDVKIQNFPGDAQLSARMEELLPGLSGPIRIKAELFAGRVVANLFAHLSRVAEKSPSL